MCKKQQKRIATLILSILMLAEINYIPIIAKAEQIPETANQDTEINKKVYETKDEYNKLIENIGKIEEDNANITEDIDVLKKQINSINEVKENADKIIENIEQQINYLSQQVEYTDIIAKQYSEILEQKTNDLKEAEKNEEEKYDTLCNRIRIMEESQRVTFWQILFDSESIKDFLNRLNFISEVMTYDKSSVEELNEIRQKATTERAEYYQVESKYQKALSDQQSQKAELENENNTLNEKLALLGNVQTNLLKKIEDTSFVATTNTDGSGLTQEQKNHYIEQATKELNNANMSASEKAKRIGILTAGLGIVGRVNYFWGGRSYTPGWNDKWGTMQPMQHTGCDEFIYGQNYPYGLDCGGFVFWCALTMYEQPSWNSPVKWMAPYGVIGIYQSDNAVKINYDKKLPGDIVVYEDLSHIGYYLCTEDDGKVLYMHCTYPGGVRISTGKFTKAAKIV